jgi:hypothetical protein
MSCDANPEEPHSDPSLSPRQLSQSRRPWTFLTSHLTLGEIFSHPDGLFQCHLAGQWKLSTHATMAPPSGAAAYKKTDGSLTISADEQSVTWTPAAAGAAAPITIHVANISSEWIWI